MKLKFIFLLILITGSCLVVKAQVRRVTIIESLETNAPGEGVVKITADSKIKELIGFLSTTTNSDKDNVIKTNGFRVQVFMSNDSRTARREVDSKRNLIKEAFSDVFVYESYTAPYWKLFAGDFLTREEAETFKQQLLKAIPALGKEMYVIQDKVSIQLNKTF